MYKIKLGINTRAILKPKTQKIYPGVEEKYKRKGSWNASVQLSKGLVKKLEDRYHPCTRAKSLKQSPQPRGSEMRELSLNNFDSLTGFESVFRLMNKQKQLMALEVKFIRKKNKRKIKKC